MIRNKYVPHSAPSSPSGVGVARRRAPDAFRVVPVRFDSHSLRPADVVAEIIAHHDRIAG